MAVLIRDTSYTQTGEAALTFKSLSSADLFPFFNDKKYFIDVRVNDINIKAIRHFIMTYTNAEDEKWYKMSDGFIASFTKDSVQKKAIYDLKGGWRCTLSALNEAQMPADIKDEVKSAYPGFDILIAYEINTEPASAYIIKIESNTKIKILQIVNGEIEETGDYIKG